MYQSRLIHPFTFLCAQQGGNHLVGTGVEVVKNGLGELAHAVHLVEELGHLLGGIELADGVEAGIGTEHSSNSMAHGSVCHCFFIMFVGAEYLLFNG